MTTAFSISNAQGKRVEGEAPRSEYRKAAKEMADQLSTAEYTPTTEEVQDSFVLSHTSNYDSYMTGVPASDVRREYYEAFNRWRAVDHREVSWAESVHGPVSPETDETYIAWAAQEANREQARVFVTGLEGDFPSGWRDGFEAGLLHRALAAVPPVTEEPEWEYAVGTYDEDSGELIVDDMPTYYYPPTERAELDEGWFIVRKPVVPQQEWEVEP